MSWTVVAKKDFQDAMRSRLLWGLTVLFVLFMAGIAYIYQVFTESGGTGDPTVDTLGLIAFLSSPVTILVPIIGLFVGHKAIVGEVESGSAKLLLSLPHSRRDAVLGKVVGRAVVLSVSILVGLVASLVVMLALYDTYSLASFAVFGVFSLGLGAVYTAIGVGISSLTNDSGRATLGAIGFYFLVEFLIPLIPTGLVVLLDMQISPDAVWPLAFTIVAPSSAYTFALANFVPEAGFGIGLSGLPDSILLDGPTMVVVLLAWLVLTPLVGYLRFNGRDL
ncbi:ABC transporter permease subunit [Salarchaeum sp. JOR-1]|uniref:ABC transporter permease subunit n=1 Tax=Salarchaeum sp. JOR-1 TaxID=2599399 RepID=UPI00119899A6|nr:ABC transporter permease subunit [Salarchaeum sp. JOR-1]QDX40191.1 ABC transporter permease [Salarchaeum sp. JOR-1]